MALGGRTDLSPAKQLQRLRVRHEKQADIHEAFLSLGRSLISWRFCQPIAGRVESQLYRKGLTRFARP
jgi:hypothetical protein